MTPMRPLSHEGDHRQLGKGRTSDSSDSISFDSKLLDKDDTSDPSSSSSSSGDPTRWGTVF